MNKPPKENSQTCSCGRHKGVGQWSAEKRAAVYGRQRDAKAWSFHTNWMHGQQIWLRSWEEHHGRVRYDADGELIPNEATPQEIQNRRYGE